MTEYAANPREAVRQGSRARQHISDYSLEAATENTVRAIIDASGR
jgi:hypothetical protein